MDLKYTNSKVSLEDLIAWDGNVRCANSISSKII